MFDHGYPGWYKEQGVGVSGQLETGGAEGHSIPVVWGRGRYDGSRGAGRSRGTRDRYLITVPCSAPLSSAPKHGGVCNPDPGFRFLLFNARSVVNKTVLVQELIRDEDADLACITETWLGPEGGVPLSEICPAGFEVWHQPRNQGRGGGVAIVARKSLGLRRLAVTEIRGSESLFMVLDLNVQVGVLLSYLPPSSVAHALPELAEEVASLAVEFPRLIVLGDFNLPSLGESSGPAREFMVSMATMGLNQIIQGPTHEGGNSPDVIFLSEQLSDGLEVRGLETLPLSWSDHFLLRLDFRKPILPCREAEPIKWFRPRRLMDPVGFQTALGVLPDTLTHGSAMSLAAAWNIAAEGALDRIVPLRPLRNAGPRRSPWYTEELRGMKRFRRRLEKRWRATKSESARTRLTSHIKSYLEAIKAAKSQYFSALIVSAENRPAALFRVTRTLLNNMRVAEPLQGSAEDFNNFFADKVAKIRADLDSSCIGTEVLGARLEHSLWDCFDPVSPDEVDRAIGAVSSATCLLDPCPSWLVAASRETTRSWIQAIVNASLREGSFPAPYKEAIVRPLLKKPSLDPAVLNNYRPVSNLPFVGKVVEKVVALQLQAALDESDYLGPFQSGFRPGYSTETALIALTDDLWRARDRGESTILVLLDLSAAFDTIDHGILLQRLGGLGVGGTVLQWFSSYLSDRSQSVLVRGVRSSSRLLPCGVPQGSVLSPLLFNIYMKPLGEIIRRHGVGCHQYADDTQLYISTPCHVNEAAEVMCRCLEAVRTWMGENRLKLNPDKTEWLWVLPPKDNSNCPSIHLGGEAIPASERVRNLGVLLDPQLNFEHHIAAVTRGAFAQVRLVHQLRPYLDCEALRTVTHALITSRLDYCNALYLGQPLKNIRRLQLVQNAAARAVVGLPRRSHISPTLRALHWLPMGLRVQFKVLVITFKALHGIGPMYLRDRLQPHISHRPVRAQRVGLLDIPTARQCRLSTPRGRAFSVAAPALWNQLPPEIRTAPTLLSFRKLLKTHLFRTSPR